MPQHTHDPENTHIHNSLSYDSSVFPVCLEVMKCIVEALADVLSMPHPVPVSQECLDTLRTGKKSA